MCGGSAPETVKVDPEADAEKAASEAAVAANSQAALRRRSRRQSALLVSNPTLGGQAEGSVLTGRQVLGG